MHISLYFLAFIAIYQELVQAVTKPISALPKPTDDLTTIRDWYISSSVNPLTFLGLDADATYAEAHSRAKKLLVVWHPDKVQSQLQGGGKLTEEVAKKLVQLKERYYLMMQQSATGAGVGSVRFDDTDFGSASTRGGTPTYHGGFSNTDRPYKSTGFTGQRPDVGSDDMPGAWAEYYRTVTDAFRDFEFESSGATSDTFAASDYLISNLAMMNMFLPFTRAQQSRLGTFINAFEQRKKLSASQASDLLKLLKEPLDVNEVQQYGALFENWLQEILNTPEKKRPVIIQNALADAQTDAGTYDALALRAIKSEFTRALDRAQSGMDLPTTIQMRTPVPLKWHVKMTGIASEQTLQNALEYLVEIGVRETALSAISMFLGKSMGSGEKAKRYGVVHQIINVL